MRPPVSRFGYLRKAGVGAMSGVKPSKSMRCLQVTKKSCKFANAMIKILFVCHGNICRSPMAEFVMKDLVRKAGLADDYLIASAATSMEEIGNEVYPPARRKLAEHDISCKGKTARQMTRSDYDRYDLLIGMDTWNIRNMNRICGGDPEGKIRMLMDYTDRPGDVADPWYTGNFEATWQDVLLGCQQLLRQTSKNLKTSK